jgi:hypothetical protein
VKKPVAVYTKKYLKLQKAGSSGCPGGAGHDAGGVGKGSYNRAKSGLGGSCQRWRRSGGQAGAL